MKLHAPPKLTGKYLYDVLQSNWLTTGLMAQRLQAAVAEFLKCRPWCVVLASSATAAWQGIVNMVEPSRFTTTEATWPGMIQAMRRAPGFPNRMQIHLRTDIGGARCDDSEWKEGAIRVRDACHSWVLDPTADYTLFSFYPTKLVPGAEGGCVVCSGAEYAERLRLHLYCGMQPGQGGSGKPPALNGIKANMTDVTAALNLEALELAPAHMVATAKAWARMADFARSYEIPFRGQPVRPYLFQVEMPEAQIPAAMQHLRERQIPSAWNFPPAGLLTVPCHQGLDDGDRIYLIMALSEFLNKVAPSL